MTRRAGRRTPLHGWLVSEAVSLTGTQGSSGGMQTGSCAWATAVIR